MKVLLITMTGRPLGLGAALAIYNSPHELVGIVTHRRFAGRGSKISYFIKSLKRHGFHFLFSKIKESLLLGLGLITFTWEKYNPFPGRMKSLSQFAQKAGIQYISTDNINSKEIVEKVYNLKPDVIVLVNAPIIKKPLIDTAGLCVINLHRSLLPKYAGLDAIFWALYYDEKQVGATIHIVTEKIDDGAVIVQEKREVKKSDNLETLTKWYFDTGPDMVADALEKIEIKTYEPKTQNLSERSYYSWPTRQQRKELRKKLLKRRRL